MNVPLKAAFGGLRGFPWLALSSSSVAPLLMLGEETIEYRIVMGVTTRSYSEIESVDFRSAWRTRNILLTFRGAMKTFAGNVIGEDRAREAIALLREKGCPLTGRAERFLSGA